MLCFIFSLSIVSATAFQGLSTSQMMMADHVLPCRAHCVDAFALKSDHLNDSSCYYQSDCQSCWKYCETFYRKYLIMDSICEDSRICFTGCQMACYAYRDDFRTSGNQEMIWMSAVPLKIHRLTGMNKLEIQWQSPVPLLPTSSPVRNIVYALFWKKAHQKIWVPLKHTINNSITINNLEGFSSYVDFLLLAYTRDGEISGSLFTKEKFQKMHELNNVAAPETYYCSNEQEMTFVDPFIIVVCEAIFLHMMIALIFSWKKKSIILFILSYKRNRNFKRRPRMSNEGNAVSLKENTISGRPKELFTVV
ncbi:hypothetical protein T10_12011 [Trichinella papuae]|uniref:Fibronectin type-III domain-containing protein n=1 Tax=Trichinella papuae TaxID=268474 RepID=A0A0V1MD50_9BILA|nr:hypothetical protein T10_12011 [Trichinella papuae]